MFALNDQVLKGTATFRWDDGGSGGGGGEDSSGGGPGVNEDDSVDIGDSGGGAREMATLDSVIMAPTSPCFIPGTGDETENKKQTGNRYMPTSRCASCCRRTCFQWFSSVF